MHLLFVILGFAGIGKAEDEAEADTTNPGTVEADLGASREASRTDDEVVQREEEAIKLDGLSVSQVSSKIKVERS